MYSKLETWNPCISRDQILHRKTVRAYTSASVDRFLASVEPRHYLSTSYYSYAYNSHIKFETRYRGSS